MSAMAPAALQDALAAGSSTLDLIATYARAARGPREAQYNNPRKTAGY